MMFPILTQKITRLFSCLGIASLFCVGSYLDQAVAEPLKVEPQETVRLYDKISGSDRVPVVTCIDLEKSGNFLAVGGDDQVVRLWDVKAKGFTRELPEHLDWVRGLAFSPDQTRLATLGQDGQIKLWNIQNQNAVLVKTLKTPVRGGQKILFHPNGSQFAVCGFAKTVQIYDSETGNLRNSLDADGTNNRAIAYSADGSLMAIAGRTGVIRVWRTSDYQKISDLPGDGRRVHALAFSPDSSQLASGGEGPFVIVWNLADGKATQLDERPGKTYSLVFCGNNEIASGESDNVVRIWDIHRKENTATLLGHTGTVSTMIYEKATNRLITGSFDTSLRFWTLSTVVASAATPIQAEISTPASLGSSFAEPVNTVTPASPFAEPVNTVTPSSPFAEPVNIATPATPITF